MELRIHNLTKEYHREKRAVDNLSLDLTNGMFGLLGPNGAGKTTVMKILVTLLEPTSGVVRYDGLVLGKDNQDIRRVLGYLPQEYGLYPSLTARELLNYMATLHGTLTHTNSQRRIDAVLAQVNLSDVADQSHFSGDNAQDVFVHQPKGFAAKEPR